MKERKTYYRRKEGKIIAEGKMNNKTIFLFTVPGVVNLAESSLFTEEKKTKIMEKINRLDIRAAKVMKKASEVRITNVIGSSEKDDELDLDDEINELVGRTDNIS